MFEVPTVGGEFDLRVIPVEAERSVDWAKVQSDFQGIRAENIVNYVAGNASAPVYPIFEVAVWELDAFRKLVAALDAHHKAREQKLITSGIGRFKAQQQLESAEAELADARAQFLEAFHNLNQQYDSAIGKNEDRLFAAVNALEDLEAAWQSRNSPTR